MSISTETKTTITRTLKRNIDDLYPDREATRQDDGTYKKKDTGSTWRLNRDDISSTTDDMSELFTWEYGDKIYGTHAKAHFGMSTYRKDIARAYGKEDSYQDIYIDTLSSKKLVSEQLKELNNK